MSMCRCNLHTYPPCCHCRYVCLLCLLRASGLGRAAPMVASGFVCPYGDKPITQDCPTASCTVTGLTAGEVADMQPIKLPRLSSGCPDAGWLFTLVLPCGMRLCPLVQRSDQP